MKKFLGILLVMSVGGTLTYFFMHQGESVSGPNTSVHESPQIAGTLTNLPLPEPTQNQSEPPTLVGNVDSATQVQPADPAPTLSPDYPAPPAFVILPVPSTDNLPDGVYNPNRLATGAAAIAVNETVPSAKAAPTPGTLVYDAHVATLNSFVERHNPFGPWKFGWSKSLTDPLSLFSSIEQSKQDNGQEAVWFDPANYYNVTPSVRYNFGPDFSNGDVTFKSGALLLTPGYGTRKGFVHVVWTAPEDGNYSVSCAFYGQQKNIGVEVKVLVKGEQVFTAALTQTGDNRAYVGDVILRTGESVDFAVGPGPRGGLVTGLDALITKK